MDLGDFIIYKNSSLGGQSGPSPTPGSEYTALKDGNTHIHIYVLNDRLSLTCSLAINGSVVISWGDGQTTTKTGSDINVKVDAAHTYAAAGAKRIDIEVTGSAKLYGYNDDSYMCWNNGANIWNNRAQELYVRCVEIGNNMTLGASACKAQSNLVKIFFPEGITRIESNTFNGCYNLYEVEIPATVTFIGDNAFYYCHSLKKLIFKSQNPPQFESSGTVNRIPYDCEIHVPAGRVLNYKDASNAPSSNYTYVEDQA